MLKLPRRSVLSASLAASTLTTVTLAAARRAHAAEAGPIRIGMLYALSGPQGVVGPYAVAGARIAAERLNKSGGLLGRQVEIVVRDDHGDPNTGIAALTELSGDGVKLFIGGGNSVVALATIPVLAQQNAVMISAGAIAFAINHEAFSPHFFRVAGGAYANYRAQAKLVSERRPDVRRWASIVIDQAFAASAFASFRSGIRDFAKPGTTMADPILTKYGATDFKTQLAELAAGNAEALYVGVTGADEVTLFSQLRNFNLQNKFVTFTEPGNPIIVAKAVKQNLPREMWSWTYWYYGFKGTELSRQLFDDYVALTHDTQPDGTVEAGHRAARAYFAGIAAAGSAEPEQVIKGLEGVTFEAVNGSYTIRAADHQAIGPINFMRMGAQDAEPGWGIFDYVAVDGALVTEPASPGKKFEG